MEIKYCGKSLTVKNINTIKNIIKRNPDANRVALSRLVCKKFDWYKANGGLQDMSCRVLMLRMDRDSLISLPPPSRKNSNSKKIIEYTSKTDPGFPVNVTAGKIIDLKLIPVNKGNTRLWNEYIDRYHYLKFTPLPGAQLRYFIEGNQQLLGCLGFGASVWQTAPRDSHIGWSHEQRKKNLHLVVNNARFLIFPWVNSKYLASKILAMVCKQLPNDWQERYAYRPVLLETFVQDDRFKGTCYSAAGWSVVGKTVGRGKLEKTGKQVKPIKSVWLKPLRPDFRNILTQ